jgi:hypothetical protein
MSKQYKNQGKTSTPDGELAKVIRLNASARIQVNTAEELRADRAARVRLKLDVVQLEEQLRFLRAALDHPRFNARSEELRRFPILARALFSLLGDVATLDGVFDYARDGSKLRPVCVDPSELTQEAGRQVTDVYFPK